MTDTPPATDWKPTHRHRETGWLYRRICTGLDVQTREMLAVFENQKGEVWIDDMLVFRQNHEPIPEAPAPARLAEIREAVAKHVVRYDMNHGYFSPDEIAGDILDTLRRMGVELPEG